MSEAARPFPEKRKFPRHANDQRTDAEISPVAAHGFGAAAFARGDTLVQAAVAAYAERKEFIAEFRGALRGKPDRLTKLGL